jgi:hypothetical protein
MQAVQNPAESAQCPRCGALYQGTQRLIQMKMRLHEKAGCVDLLNSTNPKDADAKIQLERELTDRASGLLAQVRQQQSLNH